MRMWVGQQPASFGGGGVAHPFIKFDLTRVKQLAARGLNKRQIAVHLGMSEDTLERRQKDNAAFLAAMEQGRIESIIAVADALVQKALNPSGSVAANIYWLKIMGGAQWRQDQRYQVDASVDVQVSVADERARYRAALRKATQEQRDQIRAANDLMESLLAARAQPAIESTAVKVAEAEDSD